MGTLLGIKPLVHIEEGKVVSLAKARGQKAGYQMILERVREEGVDRTTRSISAIPTHPP